MCLKNYFYWVPVILLIGFTGIAAGAGACWEFADGFETTAVGTTGSPALPEAWEFSDDFESYAGVVPPSEDDADPAAWNGVDTWETEPNDIQVFNDAAGAYQGDKYVNIEKGKILEQSFYTVGAVGTETFVLEFAMRATNAVHGGSVNLGRRNLDLPDMQVLTALGVGIQGRVLCISSQTAATGSLAALSELGLDDVEVLDGQWVLIRIEGDPGLETLEDPTFDLYADNILVGSDLPWYQPDYAYSPTINTLYAAAHGGSLSVSFQVDAVDFGPGKRHCQWDSTEDADPDHSIWNAIDWFEFDSYDVTWCQVYNDPDGAASGNQYVHLKKDFSKLERYWSYGESEDCLPLYPGRKMTIEFSMKAGNSVHGARFWIGRRYEETSAGLTLPAVGVGIQGSVWCNYHAGPSHYNMEPLSFFGEEDVPAVADKWYNVRMEVYPGIKTISDVPWFDLYIDGHLVGTGLPWYLPDFAYHVRQGVGINNIFMASHYGSLAIDACFDNIRLRVGAPQPAGDFNNDDRLTTTDLSQFVLSEWLECSAFIDPVNCPSPLEDVGSDLDGDYWSNLVDFNILANQWEQPCLDPNDLDCVVWP